MTFAEQDFSYPLHIYRNDQPRGFAENNNQAYRLAAPAPEDYFCLINPDVRIPNDVFGPLMECLEREPDAGVVAPLVRNSLGELEDNARLLPTPMSILGKVLGRRESPPAIDGGACRPVDWVAGLFMLIPARAYAAVGGLDEHYYLYYEDVDLCCRLGLAGYQVLWCPGVSALHDGRRDSHRNLRYALWHLSSMTQFFASSVYRRRRRQLHLSD